MRKQDYKGIYIYIIYREKVSAESLAIKNYQGKSMQKALIINMYFCY